MQWSGTFRFGDSSAAFRGCVAENTPHSHAAVQLILAHEGNVTVVNPNVGTVSGAIILVKQGAVHRLLETPLVTMLFLEPQIAPARKLLETTSGDEVTTLNKADVPFGPHLSLTDCLASLGEHSPDVEPRVELALEFADSNPGPRAISRAAAHAGMSPGRLRALVLTQMGVPMTAWLSWRRLQRAGRAIASGASLADAAIDGGFSDQAHFSRTTRRVFGMTPGTAGSIVRE
jgi:AraC-like DNA-binding protein